jgi:serine/threonine protein phosphatase PrpC
VKGKREINEDNLQFQSGKFYKKQLKPLKLEQVLIDDIQPNDFFLICTDGITLTWIDSDLEELFFKFNSSNDIIQEIVK